jgi:polyferredoxin
MKKSVITVREIVKWGILGLILGLSMVHLFGNKAVWAPLDAYCPFGGLESAWQLIFQGGFLEKTQPSNLAIGLGLILVTLLFGGIFCGWICPLGTLQDGLNKLGRLLKLPQITLPKQADRYLRYLRYPVLILVLFESFHLVKLWFADYDPFRIIFGLHWITEPENILIAGWIIGIGFILLSLVWRRFWCSYLCPLVLVVQWLSKISWLKIRWQKSECISCDVCNKKCPLALNVQSPKLNSSPCNNCLECVAHCPKPEALQYKLPGGAGKQNRALVVAVSGVIVFGLILIGAQLAGWWSPKITDNPENIKGWMTLGAISETYHIPISEIKKELNLPASANEETELKSFEKEIPNFEMDLIRNYVANRIGWTGEKAAQEIPASGETTNNPSAVQLEPSPTIRTATEKTIKPEVKSTVPSVVKNESVTEKANPANITTIRDPEEIKGTMSLSEVSEGWKIPLETLLEKLGVPKDINVKAPIRELENFNINGIKVRTAVKEILGQP